MKKLLDERLKVVVVNPHFEITAGEMDEICRTSADVFDIISKAFCLDIFKEQQLKSKPRKAV